MNYKRTNNPKLFSGTYWGNFTELHSKNTSDVSIIQNRDRFANEFDIKSLGTLPDYKKLIPSEYKKRYPWRNIDSFEEFLQNSNWVDHLEIYKTNGSSQVKWIIISSPYDDGYYYYDEHISNGFSKLPYSLYSTDSTTYLLKIGKGGILL
tara:strand:+ start:3975 stop:4424 length:450 start_codon:yes stop_codon:yes gene_type:complete